MVDDAQFVLASRSPRRAELLAGLGLRFRVRPADVDEAAAPGEAPAALVARLAEDKARAVAAAVVPGVAPTVAPSLEGALPVLGADTIVVLDGVVLGKPRDRDDALAMLEALSGREHEVLSGVAVACAGRVQVIVSRTRVVFRSLDAGEAAAYWATGEPADKAGAYGIQGIGGIFVDRLEGSYTGVVGLPVAETEALLRAAGVDCWRHRRTGADRSATGEVR